MFRSRVCFLLNEFKYERLIFFIYYIIRTYMERPHSNKYVISKSRSKNNRRLGRGKLMSYRVPFTMSLRKSTTSTRKKEVPPTIDVLPSSALKKGKKTHIKKKVVLHQESKAWQNICSPNKKVVFTKGKVPSF